MEQFSAQWFTAYYISLGSLLLSYGLYLVFKTESVKEFVLSAAEEKHPPTLWKKILKYFLLFTLPGLILSFTPFSWIELVFSIWSLFIIYMLGQLLILWPQTSKAILKMSGELSGKIRFVAANLISIGIILFLLCYVLIERMNSI